MLARLLQGAPRSLLKIQPTLQDSSPLYGLSAIFLQRRGAKKQANELRTGNVIASTDGRVCAVTKFEYTQGHGRQLGNVHVSLWCAAGTEGPERGRKTQERRRPYDMVETVRLESQPYQYLYEEGGRLSFMNESTFEQVSVDPALFAMQRSLMKEGSHALLSTLDGEVLSGELPSTVTLTIKEADPYVQGDSVNVSTKGAVLETGARIAVPVYVQPGERVVVNTADRSFVKRAS